MAEQNDHLQDVPVGLLRRYLILHGWKKPPKQPTGLELYVSSGEHPLEVVLPTTSQSPDAIRWTTLALRTVAQQVDRDFADVLSDVRSVGADIVKSRLADEYVRNDTVDLEVAAKFIRSMRGLLASAATTELVPERLFGRIKKEGQSFADQCRFGHTFRGSFGFTVESQISRNEAPMIPGVEQPAPFERRVLQRIIRGFKSVESAAEKEEPNQISGAYRSGLSANMCDELVSVLELTPSAPVRFEWVLSPEWHPPSDISSRSHAEVGPQHIDVLKEAAKQLRNEEFTHPGAVTGRVTRLKSDEVPNDLNHPEGREITLCWESGEYGRINLKIRLQPSDYLLAVEAHRTGKQLSVTGTPEKIGRSWSLSDPTSVSIAADTSGEIPPTSE